MTDEVWNNTVYVDSFETAELVFPMASVIGVHLYDSNQEAISEDERVGSTWVRMSPERARVLAGALLQIADDLEGAGQKRQ